MKTYQLIPLVVTLAASCLSEATTMPFFPQVSGKDLNNKPWNAPGGFPGERNLVVFGFEEEQQAGIDSWFNGMEVRNPSSKIPWIEMPLIQNPGMIMRWFINSGMRGGIPDKEVRSHVWTAYTDKAVFMKDLGITSTGVVYAVVVERTGNILAAESGNYSEEGRVRLLRALHPR